MSDRYKGGILSPTAPTVIPQSAGGVYTLSQQLQYQGQGVWPPAVNYPITKSLRFRSSASAYLNRTPASAGNRRTFTWSGWVKLGALGTDRGIFGASQGSGYGTTQKISTLAFTSTDTLRWVEYYSADGISTDWSYSVVTTPVYRDPSAWYHIVVAIDTTQATAANRVKLYVNGLQVTALGTANYPTQNFDSWVNTTSTVHQHGLFSVGTPYYFDGYLGEVNFIDGQALTPSSFGETSTTTGVWIPKKYTGTYGTNGFYLPFTDTTSTSTLGTDFSGNSNTWTVNNISLTSGSTYDSMNDVPTLTSATTANYAVLNPVYKSASQPTISSGNLEVAPNAGTYQNAFSTIAITTGKWYCELLVTGTPNSANFIGISNQTQLNYLTQTANVIGATTGVGYSFFPANGDKYTNGTQTSYGTSVSSGDIVGIAVDLDNGKIWFSKNGTWQASGDPAAGTNAAFTGIASDLWSIGATVYSGGVTNFAFNFGQRPFSYTPPTGFVALNTFNLPTPTIGATASSQADNYFNAVTYTGTSGTQAVTGVGFQPDFVWIKNRTSTLSHVLQDAVRGTTAYLVSNATTAENTNTASNWFRSFDSDGFTVATLTSPGGVSTNEWNNTGYNYVGWNWKANGAGSTNTAGSITSTVSANTTAGFSIVTYTGNATNGATVGHGLGVSPSMIIGKIRSTTGDWYVWQTAMGDNFMKLNTTAAQLASTANGVYNTASFSSTVFALGSGSTMNASGGTFVAYCFAQVAGYSAFGSYTGNGSSDGPFIYTGFRPRYVMIKRTDAAESWVIDDSSRSPYNVTTEYLLADSSSAAGNVTLYDFLSNGFKPRGTSQNNSGGTFIYMAFAESPFKYSLAR